VLATLKPRHALLDAYLVALVVSLLVNDTPVDVAGFGGLAALGLWLYARSAAAAQVDSRADAPSPAADPVRAPARRLRRRHDGLADR
jgi:hypothetical protein